MSGKYVFRLGAMTLLLLAAFQVVEAQYQFTRCPLNPVMPPGPSGSWDSRYVLNASVVHRDGHYYMWYSGWSGSGQFATGIARSFDGVRWSRYIGNPIMEGSEVWWSMGGVRSPAVSRIESQYVMLFMMYPSAAGPMMRLGIAASQDGISWHIYANPIIVGGEPGEWDSELIGFPSPVIEWHGRYWTWYSGRGGGCCAIGAATSPDLIHWTKHSDNPVMIHGMPIEWDGMNVQTGEVHIRGGKLEMWYTGWPNESQCNSGFGVAFSEDGIHWHKSPDNPVFVTGASGQWDDRFIGSPSVVYDPDSVRLWYTAYSYSSPWSSQWNTGFAISAYSNVSPVKKKPDDFEDAKPYIRTCGPNPFREMVEFEVSRIGCDSKLIIFNVLGQKVRELILGDTQRSGSRILWDGRDNSGRLVANGMYFVRLYAGGRLQTTKVLKMGNY